jgi:hypothetical protein
MSAVSCHVHVALLQMHLCELDLVEAAKDPSELVRVCHRDITNWGSEVWTWIGEAIYPQEEVSAHDGTFGAWLVQLSDS